MVTLVSELGIVARKISSFACYAHVQFINCTQLPHDHVRELAATEKRLHQVGIWLKCQHPAVPN